MLLATGLYMASQGWGLKSPWVDAAMAGLVALAALNLPAQVRFLRAIGPLLSGEPGASPSHDLRARLADPTCRIAMWFANGLALGILWLMAAKPGAVGSGSVLVGAAALLGGIGLLIERKGAAKAVTEQ